MGDPPLEALFEWGPNGPAIQTMGALGGGEGNHWLSGPIYVCDAEPGDVLQASWMGAACLPCMRAVHAVRALNAACTATAMGPNGLFTRFANRRHEFNGTR